MSKFLSLIGLKKKDDDNIPEMILHKNDPQPYYDKDLKCWMIPGQEEEIKKMVADQRKPPSVIKSQKKDNSDSNNQPEANENSLVNPRKPIQMQKKSVNKGPSSRYATTLPETYLDKTPVSIPEEKTEKFDYSNNEILSAKIEKEKDEYNPINNPQGVLENIVGNQIINQPICERIDETYKSIDNFGDFQHHEDLQRKTFQNSYALDDNKKVELINSNNISLKKNNKNEENTLYYSVDNSISLNTSGRINQNINIEKIIEDIKQQLAKEIKKNYEEEFYRKKLELENNYISQITQINDINEFLKSKEISLQSEISILKKKMSKFIEDNIIDNIKIDELNHDLIIKDKEIENMRNILNLYIKSRDEKETCGKISKKEEVTFQLMNSPYDIENYYELQFENMKLINEMFSLKKDLANSSLEKSFADFRSKEQERNSKIFHDNLVEKNHQLEKSLMEANKQIENLLKTNSNLEKDFSRMDEITKLNENLKLNLINLENQISNLKKTNDNYSNTIKNLKKDLKIKINEYNLIEGELMEKMNYSSTKILNSEKEIKILRSQNQNLNEKINQLENNKSLLIQHEKEISDLQYKIFSLDNELKGKLEENERIKDFFKHDLIKNLSESIRGDREFLTYSIQLLHNEQSDIRLSFDKLITLIFKKFSNNLFKLESELEIKQIENSTFINECESQKRSLEVLHIKNFDLLSENEILKNNLSNLNEEIELFKNEITSLKTSIEENEDILLEKENKINDLQNHKSEDHKQYKAEIDDLHKKITSYEEKLEQNKSLNEQRFALGFERDRIASENDHLKNSLLIGSTDINKFIMDLPELDHFKDIKISIKEINTNETKMENVLIYNIKVMKNIIENLNHKFELKQQENLIQQEELQRSLRLIDIKENEYNLYVSETEKFKHIIEENNKKEKEMNKKIESIEKDNQSKQSEIQRLLTIQTGTQSDKIKKLNDTIEENRKEYEIRINNFDKEKIKMIENGYQEKIHKLQKEVELLQKKKNIEISEFNNINDNKMIENVKKYFAALYHEIYDELQGCELNLPKELFIEEILNKEFKSEESALFIIINNLLNKIKLTEKELLKIRTEKIVNREEKNILNPSENKTLEQQEIDVLLKSIDEKDREINDLKQQNSDLEIQLSKNKNLLEEAKKNYDYLLNNYKSAEKLSHFQNKVSQLSEEKAVILQTTSETIKNLTTQISELTLELNDYKKKELEDIKPIENINEKSSNIKKNTIEQKIIINESITSAESFFNHRENKENKKQIGINPFDEDENPKQNFDIYIKSKQDNEFQDDKKTSEINKEKNIQNIQKKEHGFFTRFIAPIFLTENELNSLNKN